MKMHSFYFGNRQSVYFYSWGAHVTKYGAHVAKLLNLGAILHRLK